MMTKKLSLIIFTVLLLTLTAPFALVQGNEQGNEHENDTAHVESDEVATEASAVPSNSESFAVQPVYPNSINSRKFIFEMRPGDSEKDYLKIKNLSSERTSFQLYGADPTFSAQGTPAYKTRQNGGTGEGSWIKFDSPEIELKAGEERDVAFRVDIPADTELGDYRIGIAAEKIKKGTEDENITIAIRIITHAAVKVTDSPKPVPKLGEAAPQDRPWQVYYFYGSLTLFILSFLALIWVTLEEKQAKAMAAATKRKPAAKVGTKTRRTKKRATTKKRTPVKRKPSKRK